ncbi:class I SAM-dependent RNA methyltransferase [Sandarakinorhabdus sp.]|uniref:class I SAM-dependent RNA methyltransferase n=1 Tax=Sandarakinorhabdus sp. TaxID=1916663 RepID=UPI00286DCBC0|nr:class I SAM-dependent RNA methyltransferase [Sandarakinorhabdus sp.]
MTDVQPIVRLAARGDGVTADGRFAALAAIGDMVDFARDPPQVVPGPEHAPPPCRHFPVCGGCQLQHLTDTAYAEFAADRLRRVLPGLDPVIMAVALSPPRSRRRASLKALKRGNKLILGFHTEGTHKVVDVQQCEVIDARLFALLAPLRGLLSGVLADGQGAGVALTLTDTGIDLLLANVTADRLDRIEALLNFADAHDLARLSIEGPAGTETMVERRPPQLTMGGIAVTLPPAPFLQATPEGEAALVAAVLAGCEGAARVADLFCGLGTFALPLSRQAQVLAVDAAGPALAALNSAARMAGRRIDVQHRDLFRRPLTPAELAVLDAVVFDPPRAGAEAQARALAASVVPVVVAVSCNPNTFGRDAKILIEGGYRIEALWPVAQFRWSSHVELIARFVRPG